VPEQKEGENLEKSKKKKKQQQQQLQVYSLLERMSLV
jgi:hypothetical protein